MRRLFSVQYYIVLLCSIFQKYASIYKHMILYNRFNEIATPHGISAQKKRRAEHIYHIYINIYSIKDKHSCLFASLFLSNSFSAFDFSSSVQLFSCRIDFKCICLIHHFYASANPLTEKKTKKRILK